MLKQSTIKIDFHGSIPIGKQLKDYIRKKIKKRELLPGDKLPSLRKLQMETGISLGIIRQVIGDLASEGWLRMHQGSGVFVADLLSGPKNVALVLPCIGPEHITYIIKGVKEELSRVNASLVLHAASNDYTEEADIINMLDSNYVSGAIIYPPPTQTYGNALKELTSRKVPIVLVDTLIKTVKLDSVTVNHRKMGFEAMHNLLQNGHRNIGILGLDSTVFSFRELLGGFKDAAELYNIDFEKLPKSMSDSMQMAPNNPWQKSEEAVSEFLTKYPDTTAIIGCNENISMGAFLGLKKLGKKIPEDISLISLGALDCFKVSTPTISCVNQPYEEIGKLAAMRMLQLLGTITPHGPVAMQLDPIVEQRDSVANISR
jgi:DNA-binding LacI/PurR family transcriptional regulator